MPSRASSERARGSVPSHEEVAQAAALSPLSRRSGMSKLADQAELRYREEIERYDDPRRDVVRFIEGKELKRVLETALETAGIAPAGTVVELGAGTCWLSSTLATRPQVERATGVEFSDRRLTALAPIAIAHSGAPPAKVERLIADFYDHGIPDETADYVFTDASFHHAANPARLAGVIARLLRPGGYVVLLREPTLSILRRSRNHGEEGKHGSFEHEYFSRDYLGFLTGAGLAASKYPVQHGFSSQRDRLLATWPISKLNGVAFSRYLYVGRKPPEPLTSPR